MSHQPCQCSRFPAPPGAVVAVAAVVVWRACSNCLKKLCSLFLAMFDGGRGGTGVGSFCRCCSFCSLRLPLSPPPPLVVAFILGTTRGSTTPTVGFRLAAAAEDGDDHSEYSACGRSGIQVFRRS